MLVCLSRFVIFLILIIRIYHDARSSECQMHNFNFLFFFTPFAVNCILIIIEKIIKMQFRTYVSI